MEPLSDVGLPDDVMAMAAHLVSSLLLIETSFLPETRLLLRGVVKEVFRCSGKRAKWAWSLCFAKSW